MVNDENYLWAGTCGQGLLRVDKTSGETVLFTLSNTGFNVDDVCALAFDSRGALLVGTSRGGIVRYNGSSWEQLPGLPDTDVLGMTIDNKGSIWAWMQNLGIVRQDGSAWQPVMKRFSGMLTSGPNGNVWMVNTPQNASGQCSDGRIDEYVNGEPLSTISLASVCSAMTNPMFIAVDNKKNCWVGTYTTLLQCNEQSIQHFEVSDDTTSSRILTSLAVNHNDQLLLSLIDYTDSCELCFYDPVNGKGQPFDSIVIRLYNQYITTACADRKGGFWCASSNGTIIRIDELNRSSFFNTGNTVLPGNSIRSLLIDKSDNVWVGTSGGIARFDGTVWNCYSPAAGDTLCGPDARCLALDSSGIIWAGFQQPLYSTMTQAGLSYFVEQHWRGLKLDHISIKAIAVAANGDQWVVDDDGVYRYRDMIGERLFETVYSSDRRIVPGTSVHTITFDDDTTPWIGTDLGIKKYIHDAWVDDTTINRYLQSTSVADVPVAAGSNVIVFRYGATWTGTANGLFKCSSGVCERFDTAGGVLPDNTVRCIAVDTPGSAWIGTARGLVHFDGANRTTYTLNNSPLRDNDITALAAARNGDMWVGTGFGGVTFLPVSGMSITTDRDIMPQRNRQPSEISYRAVSRRSCRITIRTGRSPGIGFSLLSLQGKLIRRFNAVTGTAGCVTFTWDGTDRFGRSVSAGTYLGIVTIDGKCTGSKLLQRS
jgi:ligand-binding sensor domain-containing protein